MNLDGKMKFYCNRYHITYSENCLFVVGKFRRRLTCFPSLRFIRNLKKVLMKTFSVLERNIERRGMNQVCKTSNQINSNLTAWS